MSKADSQQIIPLEKLPQYTSWISFLLGLETFPKSLIKTNESILREYDDEKWGLLLDSIRDKKISIHEADNFFIEPNELSLYFELGQLINESKQVIHKKYLDIVNTEIERYIGDSTGLFEIGAGYGTVIAKLAIKYSDKQIYAGEYTNSGVECMNILSQNHQLANMVIGNCDLNNLNLDSFGAPDNLIFFTSWTMPCIKGFPRKALNEIIRHNPLVVIHFEPIYEHWTDSSLLEMLWKSYAKLNDYNQSMYTDLRTYQDKKLIKIIEERINLFGMNPLFPMSIIKWTPV